MKVQELLEMLMRVDPETEVLAIGFDDDEAYDMITIDAVLTKPDGTKQLVIAMEPTGGDPVGTINPYIEDDGEDEA